jgi:SAM-dependent methyltransferase
MMTRTSQDAAAVVAKGGSTHALEAMYTRYHRRLFSRGPVNGLADLFWHHAVSQPKALRNRLRIVRKLVKAETIAGLQARQRKGAWEPLQVLSIAGGSSRSIIQTIVDLRIDGWELAVEVVILDKDRSALDVGACVAREAGVSSHFRWLCGSAQNLGTLLPEARFDIIEVVGLVDYFSDARIIRLLKDARTVMTDGAVLIAANVMPNSEMPFVHKTGWPRMVYRTPSVFRRLFDACGFAETEFVVEPLKVHCIAIARK